VTHILHAGLPLYSFTDDYRAHTSCITEAERYEKKTIGGKPGKRNPQQEWMNIVESCADTCTGPLKNYMQTMSTLDNVPRQEKKFYNWAANSLNLRGRNETIAGEIFNVLKEEREKRQKVKEQVKAQQEEQKKKAQEEAARKAPEKSFKDDESDSDDEDDEKSEKADKKSETKICPKKVKKAMKKALKKAPNKAMKIKDMRKLLGEQLAIPKSAEKRLKEMVLQAPEISKSKIIVDGKVIKLQ
jgi:cell growth-regulating nucleolar protein